MTLFSFVNKPATHPPPLRDFGVVPAFAKTLSARRFDEMDAHYRSAGDEPRGSLDARGFLAGPALHERRGRRPERLGNRNTYDAPCVSMLAASAITVSRSLPKASIGVRSSSPGSGVRRKAVCDQPSVSSRTSRSSRIPGMTRHP